MPCMPPLSRPFAVGLLLASLVVARSATAAPGDYDPTFDGDGVIVDHGRSETTAVVIQGDGKILAVVSDVVRYDDTGTVDTSFGTAGHATADFGTGGQGFTTALIAPDGKIVVAGHAVASPGTQLAIARFDATGTLDPTFGTGGKTLTDVPNGTSDDAKAIVRLPSGRLVIAGSTSAYGSDSVLVAYDDAGVLDAGFGTGGIVLPTLSVITRSRSTPTRSSPSDG